MGKSWRAEPLATLLGLDPCLWKLASYLGHNGKAAEEVKAFMEGRRAACGEARATWARHELTARDERTDRTVLRLNAPRRKEAGKKQRQKKPRRRAS